MQDVRTGVTSGLSLGLEELAELVDYKDDGVGQKDRQVDQDEDEIQLHQAPLFRARVINSDTLKSSTRLLY